MADHTQGHRDPDEENGTFSLGGGSAHDEFAEEPLQSGLGELFVSEDSTELDSVDEFEGEETLLDEFDEGDLEAFFDPEEPAEELGSLRSELLDEDLLAETDAVAGGPAYAGELLQGDEVSSDQALEFDVDADLVGSADSELDPLESDEDALGSLFSELGDAEAQENDGQDAWALDQVVEEGMSWLMELNEDEAGGELPMGSGSDESDDEEGDWTAGLGRPSGGRRRGLIALVVVALVSAGGFLGYREFFAPPESAPETIARVPRPKPQPPTVPDGGAVPGVDALAGSTDAGEAAPGSTDSDTEPAVADAEPGSAVDPSAPDPNAPLLGPRPSAGAATDLRDPFSALSQSGDALPPSAGLPFTVAHFTATAGLPAPEPGNEATPSEPSTPDPAPEAVAVQIESDPERASREQRIGAGDMVLLPDSELPFRLATAEDMRGVWAGATIPVDHISGPDRLLTPGVGSVRVVKSSGEVFDGVLYAVGEKKVWLEFSGGRMALLSWQIESIEHISNSPGTPQLGSGSSTATAGLDRVRVRTPGGVFYGSLLNQEGSRVTLLMGDGARITLEHATVEVAGSSRTRIIDASGVNSESPPPTE